jgi:hypothetical protein
MMGKSSLLSQCYLLSLHLPTHPHSRILTTRHHQCPTDVDVPSSNTGSSESKDDRHEESKNSSTSYFASLCLHPNKLVDVKDSVGKWTEANIMMVRLTI